MAAKQDKNPAPAASTTTSGPPEGFDVSIGRPDIDGWWNIQKGEPLMGRIMGGFVYEKDGDENRVVVVKCSQAVTTGTKDDPRKIEAGSNVGVSLRAGLADLGFYVETRAAVWIMPLDKVSIDKKRTTWKFDIRTQKGTKRAERDFFSSIAKTVKSEDLGDIPF